ncbi:hypothetical protein IRJ41_006318, partial [Triplophysa rosa]
LKKGRDPLLSIERCTVCCRRYHCAFCKLVYNHLNEVQHHVIEHVRVAVHHEDFVIMKCSLDCRKAAHYHCCYCRSTLIRKDALIKHIINCQNTSSRQPPATEPAAPPSFPAAQFPAAPSTAPQSPAAPSLAAPPPSPSAPSPAAPSHAAPPPSPSAPSPAAPSHAAPPPSPSAPSPAAPPSPFPAPPCSEPPSQAAPPPSQAAPPPSPAAPTPAALSSATPSPAAPVLRLCVRQQVRVTCIHCGIKINKRNLLVHNNRKHKQQVTEFSAKRHLSCQCIDAKNGIFAVDKSFFKPCSPIHVQKKTWGASQNITCELDECKTNSEFAVRSGILPYVCMHLKSLLFCPRMDTASIILEEEVLSEMVDANIFGDARKKSCLSLQKAAADAGVPLSVRVTVGEPLSKKSFSIYEPKVMHHSRLGRLIAAYDSKKNSWHCPCAKARQSCPHKSIAKWHLFTTDRHLFRTLESDARPDPVEIHDDTEVHEFNARPSGVEGSAYPPDDAGLRRMVQYLLQKKGLPAQLPQHLITGSRSLQDIPRQLMPNETTCIECAGHLSEPVLITAHAKLVTYTGVVDGKLCQKMSSIST